MIIFAIAAYLVGAIPIGFIICRLKGCGDIRKCGSGSIGATNVSRILGSRYFLIVFFLDALKSFALLYALKVYGFEEFKILLLAALVLVGNRYSIFLKFSGGKGIATSVGILASLFPFSLLYFGALWSIVFLISKNVGIASVAGTFVLPLIGLFTTEDLHLRLLLIFIAAWCFFAHWHNIKSFVKNKKKGS